MMETSIDHAFKLLEESNSLFVEIFRHGSLVVELYRPEQVDNQKPHDRDEVYVIVSGKGSFSQGAHRRNFKAGDLLFVPAGTEHSFKDFSDDFCTWVIFYGPVGGEVNSNPNDCQIRM